jgi:hypothetical protein
MDQAGLVTLIDDALERFAARDLISSGEVIDFLLDFRTAVVSDAAIAALIAAATAGKALVDDDCAKKAVAELTRD